MKSWEAAAAEADARRETPKQKAKGDVYAKNACIAQLNTLVGQRGLPTVLGDFMELCEREAAKNSGHPAMATAWRERTLVLTTARRSLEGRED